MLRTAATSKRILPPAWLGFYPAMSSLPASCLSSTPNHPEASPMAQPGVSDAADERTEGTLAERVKEKLIIADPSQGAATEHDTRLDNEESVEVGTGQGGEAVDRVLALAPPLPPINSGTAPPSTGLSPSLVPARATPSSTSLTPTPASASASAPAYPFPTSHGAMSRADSYSYSATEHPNPHAPTFHRPSFFRHRLYARTSDWAREREIRVRVGTYNVNDRLPPAGTDELEGWVGGVEDKAGDEVNGAREDQGKSSREKEEADKGAQAEEQGGDAGVEHNDAERQGSIGRDTPVSAGPAEEQGEEVLAFGMQEVGASRLSLPVYFASSHSMLKASCAKRSSARKLMEGPDGTPSQLTSQIYEDKPCSFPKGLPVRRTGPRPSLLDSAQRDNCTSEYVR